MVQLAQRNHPKYVLKKKLLPKLGYGDIFKDMVISLHYKHMQKSYKEKQAIHTLSSSFFKILEFLRILLFKMFFCAHTGSVYYIETPHIAKNGLTFSSIQCAILTTVSVFLAMTSQATTNIFVSFIQICWPVVY